MSALGRFVRLGAANAVQRARALAAPDRLDDADVVRIIESSTVVSAVRRGADMVGEATRSSRALAFGRHVYDEWMKAPAVTRRTATGTIFVVAGAVYIGATLRIGPPPGWLWLVLPFLAIAVGTLAVVSGVVRANVRGDEHAVH